MVADENVEDLYLDPHSVEFLDAVELHTSSIPNIPPEIEQPIFDNRNTVFVILNWERCPNCQWRMKDGECKEWPECGYSMNNKNLRMVTRKEIEITEAIKKIDELNKKIDKYIQDNFDETSSSDREILIYNEKKFFLEELLEKDTWLLEITDEYKRLEIEYEKLKKKIEEYNNPEFVWDNEWHEIYTENLKVEFFNSKENKLWESGANLLIKIDGKEYELIVNYSIKTQRSFNKEPDQQFISTRTLDFNTPKNSEKIPLESSIINNILFEIVSDPAFNLHLRINDN